MRHMSVVLTQVRGKNSDNMASDSWIKQCLERRNNGNKVTGSDDIMSDGSNNISVVVISGKGVKHELGGQEAIQRFFFGLCPVCHSIGEHDT